MCARINTRTHTHLFESHHETPVHLLSQCQCWVHSCSRDKPCPKHHSIHITERSNEAEDEDARKGLDLRDGKVGEGVGRGG